MMVIVSALLGSFFTLMGIAVMAKSPSDASTALGVVGVGLLCFLGTWHFRRLAKKDEREKNPGAVSYGKAGAYVVVAAVVLLGFGGALMFAAIAFDGLGAASLIVAAVVAAVLLAICGVVVSTQCPKCRRLWAAVLEDSTLLDRHLETEMATRTERHLDVHGKLVGTTQRDEQVLHTVETHLRSYKCKFCEHRWRSVTKERS
jgi:threonine/homoserine/homoserine lactone efflux protein